MKRKKSIITTSILSFFPGISYMYLGLLTKGLLVFLSGPILVILTVVIAESTGYLWLKAFLIPIISVSFISFNLFNSLSICKDLNNGLILDEVKKNNKLDIKEFFTNNAKILGSVLLISGITGFMSFVFSQLTIYISTISTFEFDFNVLTMPFFLLIAGIAISKSKK